MEVKSLITCILIISVSLFQTGDAVAVMSLDLGSEWMKIAVVTPGVPMEIALNVESKRKTAVAVSFRNGERLFGSEALNICVKYPSSCYIYFLDLIGKPFDHPAVDIFKKKFPQYKLEKNPDLDGVLFRHDENTVYSPEELLGMVISHAKSLAESYTDQKIKDAVITVPVFFNQEERRALITAGLLAQVNVLQLITEPLSVALNYAMFRSKEINNTVKNIMLFDMGAQDTTVSIASFQLVKTKERGFTETHPQIQILGVSHDRYLGGLNLQLKLRDHLATKFNELKKTKTDVFGVPRAMGKLFKEAGRAKNVLSANNQLFAQVENVMEDIDLKIPITRDEFYDLDKEFFEKIPVLVDAALKNAGDLQVTDLAEVILVGAGTRIPKVQKVLEEKVGQELGKSLNTDEAAAMGAVYKSADLSAGFKVKKFITKDATTSFINADFERSYVDDDGKDQIKQVSRAVFKLGNAYPQKKIMTFSRFETNFTFYIKENHESESSSGLISRENVIQVDVAGVKEALDKHLVNETIESKGVKASILLDDSGLITVTGVESLFERTISVEEQIKASSEDSKKEKDDEKLVSDDTWAKLGDTFSNLFAKDEKKETKEKDESANKEDTKTEESDSKTKKDKKTKESADKKPKKKVPTKPIVVTIKEPLEFTVKSMHLSPEYANLVKSSSEKLRALDKKDADRKAQETALNSLESFVVHVKSLYEDSEFIEASTNEERQNITSKFQEVSVWIEEEAGPFTEIDELTSRLSELNVLTDEIFARMKEHSERPKAFEALDKLLETTVLFVDKYKTDEFYNATELEGLLIKVDEIKDWKEKSLKDLESQPKHEMPNLKVTDINMKGEGLKGEVAVLINLAEQKQKADKIRKAKEELEAKKKKAEEKKNANKTETDASNTTTTLESELPVDDSAAEEKEEVESTIEPPTKETSSNGEPKEEL